MSPGMGKITPGLRTTALRIGLLPLFLPTQYITEVGTILSLCRSMLRWRFLTSADSKQNLLQRTDLVKVICRLSLTLLTAQCSWCFEAEGCFRNNLTLQTFWPGHTSLSCSRVHPLLCICAWDTVTLSSGSFSHFSQADTLLTSPLFLRMSLCSHPNPGWKSLPHPSCLITPVSSLRILFQTLLRRDSFPNSLSSNLSSLQQLSHGSYLSTPQWNRRCKEHRLTTCLTD